MAFRGKKCNGIFCEWVLVLFFSLFSLIYLFMILFILSSPRAHGTVIYA